MKLSDVTTVNEEQLEFCEKLGLSVQGDSVGVAMAKVSEMVDSTFNKERPRKALSPKQIELARQFGQDISQESKIVGEAIITDIMHQLNMNAISSQNLESGVAVINKHDSLQRNYVISSIAPDGTVYFKGGNGQRAWARSLVAVKNA